MNRAGDLQTSVPAGAGARATTQHVSREEPPTSLLIGPSRRSALSIASSRPVVLLGLRMSLLIGSVLNLINQGDALFGNAPLVPGKLLLTYLVPYCVATYSATSVTLRLARRAE